MTVLNLQVAAGDDDAYEASNETGFDGTATSVRGHSDTSASGRYFGGFRFTNVTIPPGAIVSAAVLTVVPTGADDNANILIKAEDVDNAVSFVTNADVTSRARTTASVDWAEDNVPVDGSSPDIAAVIQEVIDRAGWASGNALVVFLDGKSNINKKLSLASFEHATLNSVKLDITYTVTQEVSLAGAMASAGGNVGLISGKAAGAITPTGLHLGFMSKSFVGALTPSGAILFLTPFLVSLAGAVTPTGAISTFRSLSASLAGAITPVGTRVGVVLQGLTGAIVSSGSFVSTALLNAAGSITPVGTLALLRNLLLEGAITPVGNVLHNVLMPLSGAITPTGVMSFLLPPLQIVGRLRAYITDRDGTPRGNIL